MGASPREEVLRELPTAFVVREVVGKVAGRLCRVDGAEAARCEMQDYFLQAFFFAAEARGFRFPFDDVAMGVHRNQCILARFPRAESGIAAEAETVEGVDYRRRDAIPGRHERRMKFVAEKLREEFFSAPQFFQYHFRGARIAELDRFAGSRLMILMLKAVLQDGDEFFVRNTLGERGLRVCRNHRKAKRNFMVVRELYEGVERRGRGYRIVVPPPERGAFPGGLPTIEFGL